MFDNNNIRALTGVAIGEWTRDKLCRYALYTRTGELVLWDFGSAAVHHRLYCPWLKPENCIASYTTMRGAAPPASGPTVYGSDLALTVTLNVSVAVAPSESVTVRVTSAVPDCPAAGVSVTVRPAPAPPVTIDPAGNRAGFDDDAAT